MKQPNVRRYALLACCIVMAACSRATDFSPLAYTADPDGTAQRDVSPLSYTVLHSFTNNPDGDSPIAGVTAVKEGGKVYGTTDEGGKYYDGTVFSVTANGTEEVLHSFGSGTDASRVDAGLTAAGGELYGTTRYGGKYNLGAVFSIGTNGVEKVLHSFGSGTDGVYPQAALINVAGTLYGTTYGGGAYATSTFGGTVFSITPSGKEKVLHSFANGSDGANPCAGLIDVGGMLYGTTAYGGVHASSGTVFRITTSGTEKVLHSFGAGTDGAVTFAGLTSINGTLYGTTVGGGKYGDGSVFVITTGGTEKLLHSFVYGGSDGTSPEAGVTNVGGTLYGTTYFGGKYCFGNGCGTVFSVATNGTAEKVLHNFGQGKDGSLPLAPLRYTGGVLIGTTSRGGSSDGGTVFALTP